MKKRFETGALGMALLLPKARTASILFTRLRTMVRELRSSQRCSFLRIRSSHPCLRKELSSRQAEKSTLLKRVLLAVRKTCMRGSFGTRYVLPNLQPPLQILAALPVRKHGKQHLIVDRMLLHPTSGTLPELFLIVHRKDPKQI